MAGERSKGTRGVEAQGGEGKDERRDGAWGLGQSVERVGALSLSLDLFASLPPWLLCFLLC